MKVRDLLQKMIEALDKGNAVHFIAYHLALNEVVRQITNEATRNMAIPKAEEFMDTLTSANAPTPQTPSRG